MHPSLAYLPSPREGVWHLGPVPIRAYALCIIAGIIAAVWIGERRWVARGGRRGTVSDIAVWAVVFGLVGGRLYHVVTDPQLYFGADGHPVDALKVWQGGLGIWGAIALGGVGAWIGCRRRGIKLPPFADAAAPGIAVAQAIGRWGNWFNQELFGRQTTLPWGLEIDPGRPNTVPGAEAYHPTFLYESLWDLGLAAALVWVDRRFRLGRGRVFALYVMGYTAGRVWIEALRIDTAHHVLGLRLNIWTSILVFAGALIYFLRHPGPRETEVEPPLVAEPAEAGAGVGAPQEPEEEAPAEGTATGAGVSAAAAGTDGATAVGEPGGSADSTVQTPSPAAGADLRDDALAPAVESGAEQGVAEALPEATTGALPEATTGALPAEAEAPAAGGAAAVERDGAVQRGAETSSAAAGADLRDGALAREADTGAEEMDAGAPAAGATTEEGATGRSAAGAGAGERAVPATDAVGDGALAEAEAEAEAEQAEGTQAGAAPAAGDPTTAEHDGGERDGGERDSSEPADAAEPADADGVAAAEAQPLETPGSRPNGPSTAGAANGGTGTTESGTAESGTAQSEHRTGVGSSRGEEH